MKLVASAPGKLVLLGDYAVLEGAPALAVAIDRRAHVALATHPGSDVEICAPDLDIPAVHGTLSPDGHLRWQTDDVATSRLGLVAHIWNTLANEGLAPRTGMRLVIDTSGFFDTTAHCKLGLGSSAALTAALTAALVTAAESTNGICQPTDSTQMTPTDRNHWLTRLVRLHRGWQHSRGSGIDIAASLAGGLIGYRRDTIDTLPSLTHEVWPPAGAAFLFIWSGQSVSTARSLEQLAHWRTQHATDYTAHMGELCALAHAAPDALAGSAHGFVTLVADYAAALQRFAHASGLEIFSSTQTHLAQLAAQEGASYKPCGAGGDFGMVVADDAQCLVRVRTRITEAGLHLVPLAMATQGLQCHTPSGASIPRSQSGC